MAKYSLPLSFIVSSFVHLSVLGIYFYLNSENRPAMPVQVRDSEVIEIELVSSAVVEPPKLVEESPPESLENHLENEIKPEPAHAVEDRLHELPLIEPDRINLKKVALVSKSSAQLKKHIEKHIRHENAIKNGDPAPKVGNQSPVAEKQQTFTSASPNYRINPAPQYPEAARRLKKEGMVVLNVKLDQEGKVIELSIKESSLCEILDNAALKTVKNWKFTPAMMDNHPVPSDVEVPIKFELKAANKS